MNSHPTGYQAKHGLLPSSNQMDVHQAGPQHVIAFQVETDKPRCEVVTVIQTPRPCSLFKRHRVCFASSLFFSGRRLLNQ